MDEWTTVAECAAEVGVSQMTIYRLLHDGTLPSTRIGRSFRILRSDWADYIKEARV